MNVTKSRILLLLKLVIFILPIVFVVAFGSPSFRSTFWTIYNFRIINPDFVWTSHFFFLGILATLSLFAVIFQNNLKANSLSFIEPLLKRKNLFLLVPIIISVIIAINYFSIHNLFNLNTITYDDYPIHYLKAWYLTQKTIPRFGGIYGFSLDFWAGYPTLGFYPPGFYMLSASLNMLRIPIQATIRIFQLMILFLFPLVPFLFCRQLGHHKLSSITASFWILQSVVWIKFLIFGLVPFLTAALLGMLFVLLLLTIDQKKKFTSPFNILAASILLSLVSLMHFTVTAFLLVVLALFIFSSLKTKTKNETGKVVRFVVIVSLITFLSTFFMWSSSLLTYVTKINTCHTFGLQITNPVEILTSGLLSIYYNNIVWGLLFIVAIGVIFTIIKPKKQDLFIVMVFGASLAFVIIGLLFSNTWLDDVWLVRFLVFVEFFGAIFVSRFFDEMFKFLKKDLRQILHLQLGILNRFVMKFFYVMLLLTLVFLSLLAVSSHSYNPYQELNPHNNRLEISENEDHISLDSDVEKVIQWLEQNATPGSRVLIEDSGATGYHFWGGHVIAIMPILTNMSFIGGYQPIHWYAWSNLATCREGEAFGVRFQDMNNTYFMESLVRFNVKYLILWSPKAKSFARTLDDKLNLVHIFGKIQIFDFSESPSSYFWSSSPTAKIQLIYLEPEKILARIYNVSKGELVGLSLFTYPNYQLYLNGSLSNFHEDQPMMAFSAPESGWFSIEIIWVKQPIEIISNIISISTWMIIALYFVQYIWRRKLGNHRRRA